MTFARHVFLWAGVYGLLAIVPLFFLEAHIGREFPPATNHPEQYYAFLGVALAWQLAFLLIASDVVRYRPLMLAAMVEKFVPGLIVVGLYAVGRVNSLMLAPFIVDLLLGALFFESYRRTSGRTA